MKTSGHLIRHARLSRNLTREELAELTHIKTSFIAAIENAQWESLPEFNITLGFVKTISHFLEMDANEAVSIFRRDYPPTLKGFGRQVHQPVRKEIDKKFIWGPRLTFLALILVIVLIVFGYLGFQFRKFNSPPTLTVNIPTEGQVVDTSTLTISGKTDSDATIDINNQSVVVDDSGQFSANVDVSKNTTEIVVTAKSRSGKESVIHRMIKVNL